MAACRAPGRIRSGVPACDQRADRCLRPVCPLRPGPGGPAQGDLVPEALRRARAYLDAGADCVYPIGLWEAGALAAFVSACPGPVNVLGIPPGPSLAELAGLGVARVSYASLLRRDGAVHPRPGIPGGRAGRAPARRLAASPRQPAPPGTAGTGFISVRYPPAVNLRVRRLAGPGRHGPRPAQARTVIDRIAADVDELAQGDQWLVIAWSRLACCKTASGEPP